MLVQAVSVIKILGNFTVSAGLLTTGNATSNVTRYFDSSAAVCNLDVNYFANTRAM
jgi:hypothetical protein